MKYQMTNNPEVVAQLLQPRTSTRLVLGLDLGTNCGYTYATVRSGDVISATLILPRHMGQWDLSVNSFESGALRFLRLRQFLSAVRPDLVALEDVKYSPPGINKINANAVLARVSTAAEFLGALKCTVGTWCEEHGIPCVGFGIGTIKKRACGRGNANKEDMIKACNNTFGSTLEVEGYESTGADNVADSAFVCLLALEQYGSGLPAVVQDTADEAT
jgi:Holliday junction resolvasome RuvABC endonuclease subunit